MNKLIFTILGLLVFIYSLYYAFVTGKSVGRFEAAKMVMKTGTVCFEKYVEIVNKE